jgi:hypothetical protein
MHPPESMDRGGRGYTFRGAPLPAFGHFWGIFPSPSAFVCCPPKLSQYADGLVAPAVWGQYAYGLATPVGAGRFADRLATPAVWGQYADGLVAPAVWGQYADGLATPVGAGRFADGLPGCATDDAGREKTVGMDPYEILASGWFFWPKLKFFYEI